MNQRIQNKIDQLKKMATVQQIEVKPTADQKVTVTDSLSTAIYSKKDADIFMAELDAIVKQSK